MGFLPHPLPLRKVKTAVVTAVVKAVVTAVVTAEVTAVVTAKIESKSNVRIERNKENESCWTTWVDPRLVVEP